MDVESINAMLGVLTGALIGAWASITATRHSIDAQKARDEDAERRLHESVVEAIADEFESLWNHYQSVIGAEIESAEQNEPVLTEFAADVDYFPVYRGNAIHVGRIADTNLRRAIIAAYCAAASMIDTLRIHRCMVSRFYDAEELRARSPSESSQRILDERLSSCRLITPVLQDTHRRLTEAATEVLHRLRPDASETELR